MISSPLDDSRLTCCAPVYEGEEGRDGLPAEAVQGEAGAGVQHHVGEGEEGLQQGGHSQLQLVGNHVVKGPYPVLPPTVTGQI